MNFLSKILRPAHTIRELQKEIEHFKTKEITICITVISIDGDIVTLEPYWEGIQSQNTAIANRITLRKDEFVVFTRQVSIKPLIGKEIS